MPAGEMDEVIDRLREFALQRRGAPSDGELLEAFVARHDDAAFEALVHRHAAMVLGVCRRVVGNRHEAEDAFQATFLVLVRKAGSVVPRELVGNWLYGVAYRTALKARALTGRRRLRERRMTDVPQPLSENHAELLSLLDRELDRLPAKYRMPIILCDLECRTRREVARQLGLPVGTLSGRLTTAHRLLAKRLARHGLAVTGASLGAVLAGQAAAAAPGEVIATTIKAAVLFAAGSVAAAGLVPGPAAALAEGVLKTMLLTKLKLATAVLAGVIVLGAGVLAYEGPGGSGPPPREAPEKPQAVDESQRKNAALAGDLAATKAKLRQAEKELKIAQDRCEEARVEYQRVVARANTPAAPPEKPPAAKSDALQVRGLLRAARTVQVTSAIAGKVTEVLVQEGDAVKAGQALAALDSAAFRTEVQKAAANIELARAKLDEAAAGAMKSRITIAKAELHLAELELERTKAQLEKTQLRAPIDGVIARRHVEVGDTVNPAQAAPRLFEIIDPREMIVDVQVVERDIGLISVGQPVQVESNWNSGTAVYGKVMRIAPTVDSATATVLVQVLMKVPTGPTRWRPGMSVIAAFPSGSP